jgi:hypothetical protein
MSRSKIPIVWVRAWVRSVASAINGGLVAGSHEHVREGHHGLGADAADFDRLGEQRLHQSQDVQVADLPPLRPAHDGRPVDQSDAGNFRLRADVEPGSHGVPQGVDRIAASRHQHPRPDRPRGTRAQAVRRAPSGEILQVDGTHYAAFLDQHEAVVAPELDFLGRHLLHDGAGENHMDVA